MSPSALGTPVALGSMALLVFIACGSDSSSPNDDPTASTGTGGAAGSAAAAGSSAGGNAGTGGGNAAAGGTGPSATTATLSVSVEGDGRVVSTPAGITCGSTCQGTFAIGTQ